MCAISLRAASSENRLKIVRAETLRRLRPWRREESFSEWNLGLFQAQTLEASGNSQAQKAKRPGVAGA